MESIYKVSDKYLVIRQAEDGVKACFFECRRGKAKTFADARYYKTEENAVKQFARKYGIGREFEFDSETERIGSEAEFLGNCRNDDAHSFIEGYEQRDKVGTWAVETTITDEVSRNAISTTCDSFASEDDAWAAYDAISFRGVKCHTATKRLLATVASGYGVVEVTVATMTYQGWAYDLTK